MPVGGQALGHGQTDPPVATGDKDGTRNEFSVGHESQLIVFLDFFLNDWPRNRTRNRHKGTGTAGIASVGQAPVDDEPDEGRRQHEKRTQP
ncbi:Uncharacterised protein [Mycobacteroides abscessus subsp. abscessus]|nr:Uncharacterised protein [Mycobacteroides abscessus subsp. abscessus]